MEETKKTETQRVKSKCWRYECRLNWKHNKSAEVYFNEHKPRFMSGGGPEFGGDAANISPADLMVAALSSCVMSTFAGMAARHGIEFTGYEDCADGEMEFIDGAVRFTKVVLRPRVTVKDEDERAKAGEIMQKACANCAIGNSVNFPVTCEPEVEVG
jgi:organic hydroperoxide reductase OsmC/OhrA